MGSLSRNKGRAFEQEVARIFREHLNIDVFRNWEAQAAGGGADILLPGWACECKRAKTYLNEWRTQAAAQAAFHGLKAVLIYRLDGQGRGLPDIEKIKCDVLASDVLPQIEQEPYWLTMPLGAFLCLVREEINE